MIVTGNCLEWIKLQRSGYTNVRTEFIKNIKQEYESMKKVLPKKCNSILDIGCGVGGIDVYLSKLYNNPKLYLLDNSKVSKKITYGFSDKKSFYNSFGATKSLMQANNISNYELIDMRNEIPDLKNVDLVISLLALGFHFSLYHYIDKIFNLLSYDGIFILDIRKTTEQLEVIKLYFNEIEEIETSNPKTMRICAKGKK